MESTWTAAQLDHAIDANMGLFLCSVAYVILGYLNHLAPDKLGLNGAICAMRSTYITAWRCSSGGLRDCPDGVLARLWRWVRQ